MFKGEVRVRRAGSDSSNSFGLSLILLGAMTLGAPAAFASTKTTDASLKKITTATKTDGVDEIGPDLVSEKPMSVGGVPMPASESEVAQPSHAAAPGATSPTPAPEAHEAKPDGEAPSVPTVKSVHHEEAPAKAAPNAKTAPEKPAVSVSADQSLHWLQNGNTRFVTKRQRADGRSPDDRKRLMSGQHPHAVIVTCSDSRVPPEHIFDQGLGEIYVVRGLGPALDSTAIASVENAVNLGTKLIVVMGHSDCEAIGSALNTKAGESGSEALDQVLADIRPRLKSIPAGKTSPGLEVEATVNADGVARDLIKRSELIRKHVENGDLVIKPALYRQETGRVTFY